MKYTSYEQLPLMLNAEDIQAVMNISRSGVYGLFHQKGFPKIVMNKRMVVPRDKFLEWIEKQVESSQNA